MTSVSAARSGARLFRGRAAERSRFLGAARAGQVATGVLVVVYVASTVFRSHHATSRLYDGWIGNLGYAGCALLCAGRAVFVRERRRAWAAIAFSLILFSAGTVLWTTTVQFWVPVPYPSVSDLLFLVFYPVAFVGVGLLIRDSLPKGSRAIWLDGLIGALGVAALEAAIVIGPISHGNRGNPLTVATNLAYPIGDLVLVTLVVAAFAMRGWRPGRLWWLLGAGLAIFAGADSLYVLRVTEGTYVTGTPLDSLWLIGAFLIAVAAWERGSISGDTSQEQPVVIPTVFLASSLGIILYASMRNVLPLAVFLATATLLVAFARMANAYRQLRALAESRRQARTDDLTGLGNRRMFSETLSNWLAPGSSRQPMALLLIDLDRFKDVNDSLGHHVGDDILRQLGPLLTGVVAGRGMVARLGGDEFGLLLAPLGGPQEAMDLADRVGAALREPFHLDSMSLRVDASIGIAVAPDRGVKPETLLRRADMALYQAKRSHQPEFYSSYLDVNSRERLVLMEDLRDAIDGGEIVVHYQPKIDLASGQIDAVEALVRWQHPAHGLLQPAQFLDLVDHSCLVGPLAATVLEQALAQRARWARSGRNLNVAVNFSPANLRDQELPAKVAAALARCGVPPENLIIEITEECLMADVEQGRRTLDELRRLGVELSIDDYGTGFSSLAYLRDLPVSELKLDRSFFIGAPGDSRAVSIIGSTIDLAHSLGLRVVAEGIETADALTLVARLGCDSAQGYFLGRPVPASDVPTNCDAVFPTLALTSG